jgi:hypothetical protein
MSRLTTFTIAALAAAAVTAGSYVHVSAAAPGDGLAPYQATLAAATCSRWCVQVWRVCFCL